MHRPQRSWWLPIFQQQCRFVLSFTKKKNKMYTGTLSHVLYCIGVRSLPYYPASPNRPADIPPEAALRTEVMNLTGSMIVTITCNTIKGMKNKRNRNSCLIKEYIKHIAGWQHAEPPESRSNLDSGAAWLKMPLIVTPLFWHAPSYGVGDIYICLSL